VLTVFAVPKPFEGHTGDIQRNAIQSWTLLRPQCQVILFGDELGTRDVAQEFGIRWIPDVERNEFGTPILSSVFLAVEAQAEHRLLCYVNADVILLDDFLAAARRLDGALLRFLMVGQRWDIEVTDRLEVGVDGWEARLRERVEQSGTLHPPDGSDYFVFPRGTIGRLPSFAVGRPGWDNWMIYQARRLRIAVVDVTPSTLVVHQNHDYRHIIQGTGDRWLGPEADRNFQLMDTGGIHYSLADSTHRLTPTGLSANVSSPADLRRLVRTAMVLAPAALLPVFRAAHRSIGWLRRLSIRDRN
jgi:hypothetical protein